MASQGPNSPGTLANDNSYGTQPWTNPGNAASSNNGYAIFDGTAELTSQYLKATNFSFSVPTGATINGILVQVERFSTNFEDSGSVEDDRVRLVKGGVIQSTDKADFGGAGDIWPQADTVVNFGGAADLWAETWTAEDINASTFGVVIAAHDAVTSTTDFDSGIDHIKITVFYTVAGIAFDAASNGGYTAAASTDTWSHTNAGNYLVVGVPMLGVANVTSITFNGDSLTLLGSRTSTGSLLRVELWGMVAPDVGTFDIVVNLDGSIAFAGVASSWSGVHQTSPVEGFNSATATNVGAADATVDITSIADNCVVVDVMASGDGSVTVGTGQTSRANVTGAAGSGTMSSEGPKTPAGVVTMNWTDIGAAMTWVTGGIALRPVAAATGPAVPVVMAQYRQRRG